MVHMPLFRRRDGTLLTKKLPIFRIMNPMLMPTRTGSSIFAPIHADVTETLKYLDKINANRQDKINLFTLLLTAITRTLALRPQLNRFVIGTDIYQRNEIVLSFIAKKELTEEGRESNVKMVFDPYSTIYDVAENLKSNLSEARSEEGSESDREMKFVEKLPVFLIRFVTKVFRWLDSHNLAPPGMINSDPLYTTCYLTNMGSLGMVEAPYHHLYDWGNCSLFIVIGKYTKRPILTNQLKIEIREIMEMVVTLDDRVSEGIYGLNAIRKFQDLLEHPEELERHPEITPEILAELRLKKKKSKK
jgi:hypothetical protein